MKKWNRETPNGKVTTSEVKGLYQLNNNQATRIEVESTIVTPQYNPLSNMFKNMYN